MDDRTRVAVLSVHTSPLDQPGTGDSGGMNVYVRSVVERLTMQEEAVQFVLAGGVFTGVPFLAEELKRRLPAIAPRGQVKRLEVEPAVGAVRLALAEANGGARLPSYWT